jgi:hypothetical protein
LTDILFKGSHEEKKNMPEHVGIVVDRQPIPFDGAPGHILQDA